MFSVTCNSIMDCHGGWLVTIIGTGLMAYAKCRSSTQVPGGSYATPKPPFLGSSLGYQPTSYWLACWIGQCHAGHWRRIRLLSRFLERSIAATTITCVGVAGFVLLLNIVGPEMITRAVHSYRAGADPHRRDCRIWLVLVPVKPIWRHGTPGLSTFGAPQSTLPARVTPWSFIGEMRLLPAGAW